MSPNFGTPHQIAMNRYTSPSREMLKEPFNTTDLIANKENVNNLNNKSNEFGAYLKPVGSGNLAYNNKSPIADNNTVDTSNLLSNLKIESSGVKYVKPSNVDISNQ